ncbi:MAG: Uma2 family endonuclease [Spirulina sp. SIO3F2]|nr:Uma2 family endonuclease [Spirulina sp. SIO3F2]
MDITLTQPKTPSMLTLEPTRIKYWSVDEYHRMSELGLLDPNKRTELIAGQITLMAAKGTPHVTALRLLTRVFDPFLAHHNAFASTQDPIRLDDFSEPEPDFAVVQGDFLDYAEQHPRPDQVVLVVEVSDSTLKQDCEVKDKLYAQAGIADYWVLDLPHRQLHIFREPSPNGYTRHLILTEPNQIAPLAFPELVLTLSVILPPVTESQN